MAEELLPGLVKVAEERLGRLGRPFTTLIIISAGLGIIAWGVAQVYKSVVAPIITFFGATVDPDLAESLIALAGVLIFFAVFFLVMYYGVGWIRSHTFDSKIRELEGQIASLKSELANEDAGQSGAG